MTSPYYIAVRPIPWDPAPGDHPLALGRNVRHDSRNRAYAWARQDRELTSQLWTCHIGILDQLDVGSCTAEAGVRGLATDPIFGALPPAHPALDQAFAYQLYSAEETLDGDGPYPPQDNGSTGPTCGQVLKTMGLISGYKHAFDLGALLDALEDGPAWIGINWYSSMDQPDRSGLVSIDSGAYVRGGHEVLVRGKDVSARVIHCDNSWGPGWGANGSFDIGWDTMTRLLAEQGDVTIPVPLTQPAPQPQPAPPQPAPDPGPDDADLVLFRQTRAWTAGRHTGAARAIARDLRTWYDAKGLS